MSTNIPILFDPTNFPLHGSRLIEASAGTGKTWSIAALYVRLILGNGEGVKRLLNPSEILVMTFTRASTRELSDRIRARLLETARCFRGEEEVASSDSFLTKLMSEYQEGPARNKAAWHLAMAAENMDDAAIHTIDAWCQRMLREHAFDSGNLFDEELVTEEASLRIEATQDYWRQQCYPLDVETLQQVRKVWNNVGDLDSDISGLLNKDIQDVTSQFSLEEVLSDSTAVYQKELSQYKATWKTKVDVMQSWLEEQTSRHKSDWDGRKLSPTNYLKWLGVLREWASSDDQSSKPKMDTGWTRFTPEGLMSARKESTSVFEIPHVFVEFSQLQGNLSQLPQVQASIRTHAVVWVAKRMEQLKRLSGSFGFADMLTRLDTALGGVNGDRLRQRILDQYPVAMIDEFQDTSPIQYRIFDKIYRTETNDSKSALLLIGDPKQSIYGFRGADINSYLKAKQATNGRHYVLKTNHRSTKALVKAVNQWFEFADKNKDGGAFMFRTKTENPLPFVKVDAKGRKERFVIDQVNVPAMILVHDLEPLSSNEHRKSFAIRCADQILTWLNNAKTGFAEEGQQFKPIRPADIAVLVRNGREAKCIRKELSARNIASVYLSDKDSVFDSGEALDLLRWLRAVAMPQDVRLSRAGLATELIGMSIDELMHIASNDEAFDFYLEKLRHLHLVWQTQGVLAMLRQSLHEMSLTAQWLSETDGARKLTNFLHLAELLQTASTHLDGDQAVIRWMLAQIEDKTARSDEQIIRLESDSDLVKVITIHKSKGLEYPIVCLPFATSFRELDGKSGFIQLTDDVGERKLLMQFTKDELKLADRDRLKEDLRLLYVALTRPRHTLWVGLAATTSKGGKTSQIHKSAAGSHLGGEDSTDWLGALQKLAEGCPDNIVLKNADEYECNSDSPYIDQNVPDKLDQIRQYTAQFNDYWSIGSYTSLSRDLSTLGSQLSGFQRAKPADDELMSGGMELVDIQVQFDPETAESWHTFPRGAAHGDFLHNQLEWLASEKFELMGNDELTRKLRDRCKGAGRSNQADAVITWLSSIVQTPLQGPNIPLNGLRNVLPEMEFWLPVEQINTSKVDALCRQFVLNGVDRPQLPERGLHGLMKGFIDLVFEYEGRYWVLDYKSNGLGINDAAYNKKALESAMAEHRYDMQAAFYILALHRLLRQRLGSQYQPKDHLGGAIYLFLRGINGPEKGVCLIPPSMELIEALDMMLTPMEISA